MKRPPFPLSTTLPAHYPMIVPPRFFLGLDESKGDTLETYRTCEAQNARDPKQRTVTACAPRKGPVRACDCTGRHSRVPNLLSGRATLPGFMHQNDRSHADNAACDEIPGR